MKNKSVCPDCKGKRIVSSNRPPIKDGHVCFTCGGTGLVVPPHSPKEKNRKSAKREKIEKLTTYSNEASRCSYEEGHDLYINIYGAVELEKKINEIIDFINHEKS